MLKKVQFKNITIYSGKMLKLFDIFFLMMYNECIVVLTDAKQLYHTNYTTFSCKICLEGAFSEDFCENYCW